jgi:hypothetical protein
MNFKSKGRKINLMQGRRRPPPSKPGEDLINKAVLEERKHILDACIVRIMKTRTTQSMN